MENLEESDYYHGFVMMFIGFTSCIIIFHKLSPKVSSFFRVYSQLSSDDKLAWDNRVVSTANASFNSLLCMIALIIDLNLWKTPLLGQARLVRSSCGLIVGYFIADVYMMTWYYATLGDPIFYVHHSISSMSYFFVAIKGVFPWFAAVRMLTEMSTPLINIKWAMDTRKMDRDSAPYVTVRLVLTILFLICRVGIILPYWVMFFIVYNTPDMEKVRHFLPIMLISCVTLEIMNIFWMYKLGLGTYRMMKKWERYQIQEKMKQVARRATATARAAVGRASSVARNTAIEAKNHFTEIVRSKSMDTMKRGDFGHED